MRVLVTGGTGFVGSHSVAALVRAGHDVRLLVRDAARVGAALAPHGMTAADVDVLVGDVTDADAVDRALEGMESLLHGASVYSLDPRDEALMQRVNVDGARLVLTGALGRGLDPVVHVSSVVALTREDPREQDFRPDAPVGDQDTPYARSKIQQEHLARSLQADGAPLVITYPGAVFGPHDPHDGESVRIVRSAYRGLYSLCPRGAVAVVDVRDVAAVHAAVIEPGRGPRRFLAGGHPTPLREITRIVADAAGVRRPTIPIPDWAALATGRLADLAQRVTSRRLPFSAEATRASVNRPRVDDSTTTAALGVTFRPAEETIRDQVAWQREAGRL